MSNEIVKLTIINFDGLENDISDAVYIQEEKYFQGTNKLSAHGIISNYLRTLAFTPNLGWNQEVYPKFKLTPVNVMNFPESESINEKSL